MGAGGSSVRITSPRPIIKDLQGATRRPRQKRPLATTQGFDVRIGSRRWTPLAGVAYFWTYASQAGRRADRAAQQVRAGCRPENGEGSRHRDSAVAPAAR